jgi:hypothetical protein
MKKRGDERGVFIIIFLHFARTITFTIIASAITITIIITITITIIRPKEDVKDDATKNLRL